MSTDTEKQKKEKRNKVKEYLIDARKSIKPNIQRRQFEGGSDDGGEENCKSGIEGELNKIMDM
jgi:hypothetical protein